MWEIMSRRTFLKPLAALIGGLALPAVARAATSRTNAKTLQHSPLAGFQYHNGETLWPHRVVRPDETTSHSTRPSKDDDQVAGYEPVEGSLQLVREPENRYDDRAVRVEWQGHKLGYIPRQDNAAASQLLDRGERLEAVIVRLAESSNPWERVGVEVRWLI